MCHHTCVEVRGQFVRVLSLSPHMSPKDRARQSWRQMLNYLTSLIDLFKIWVPLNIKIWVLSNTNSRYNEFMKRIFSSSWDWQEVWRLGLGKYKFKNKKSCPRRSWHRSNQLREWQSHGPVPSCPIALWVHPARPSLGRTHAFPLCQASLCHLSDLYNLESKAWVSYKMKGSTLCG